MTENAFSPLGTSLFGEPLQQDTDSPVAKAFLVAPFSVLSARDGYWQERKRAWLAMGIRGEVGRDAIAGGSKIGNSTSDCYLVKRTDGTTASRGEIATEGCEANLASAFDPVVCELAYRWFCPEGGQVVDPFAGGSVRGIVASCLGLRYWGGELRPEQVAASQEQADALCPENTPVYVCGDSLDTLDDAPDADFVFSCPPYGNLEVYSDDPRDISNMEWHTFLATYKRIILRACKKLNPNRFACFVVGDFRDKRGFYRDFVSATIAAFKEQGLELYNEAVLVTSVGSAAMRVTKQFNSGRKLCKTHQNVLVFCKGDWRKAAAACVGRADA